MGILLPEHFSLATLANDAERRVVRALVERLRDGWYVLPSVRLFGQRRDYELDVVLLHADDGVALVEVKGYRPSVVNGEWMIHGAPIGRPPFAQAHDNAYELRERIRGIDPAFAKIEVAYGVAFPNVVELSGRLPSDVDPTQFWTAADVEECQDALDRLVSRRPQQGKLRDEGVRTVLGHLLPSCEFAHDPEMRARHARRRLDEIGAERTEALHSLDANRRVCVTGAAGTGKSRLATAWARRAVRRGERVLVTCFNVPLATWLSDQLTDVAGPDLVVGEFHGVARSLQGMPPLAQPDDADRDWWDTVEFGHLDANWHLVTERFDTIVIDEAQDLRPSWIGLLERLLDPDGPRRTLMLADTSQTIYPRGFELPRADDGWTVCELATNCRNTFEIARLLRQRFGGAVAPAAGPESEDVRWIPAGSDAEMDDAVGRAIDALEDREHGAETILVGTFTRRVRNRLRERFGLVEWERREPHAIVGENVQRIKGLQYDHVILAVHDADVTDDLLYVGISRAVMSVTVIGPPALGDRLGLTAARVFSSDA